MNAKTQKRLFKYIEYQNIKAKFRKTLSPEKEQQFNQERPEYQAYIIELWAKRRSLI